MALAIRLRDDIIAALPALSELSVRPEADAASMARLQGKPESEMARRFAAGHRAYVASWNDVDAAWGWVATRVAEIGELSIRFDIPAGERYLWNFVTRASHRGLGIYPRLLDAIVRAESAEAHRFWIAYAPENHASGTGIRKAGFATVAELSLDAQGRAAVKTVMPNTAAGQLFGIPEAADLAACWRCTRESSPMKSACTTNPCCCDYQRPEITCTA